MAERLRSPAALLTTLGVDLVVVPAVTIGSIGTLSTGALLSFHARGDVAHAVTLQILLAAGSLLTMQLWIATYMASATEADLGIAPLALSLFVCQRLQLVIGLGIRSLQPGVPEPDLTALVILTYGLVMYVLALTLVRYSRLGDPA